jgi:hypothetical protein
MDCKWEHDGYSRFKKCLQLYSTKYSQLYLKRPTKVANISYKEALTFANGSNLTIGLVRETDQIEVIGFHDVPATLPNGKTYANRGIKSQRIGPVPSNITTLILQSGMFGDILPRLVRIHDSRLPIKHGAKSDCDLLAAVYLELIKELDWEEILETVK